MPPDYFRISPDWHRLALMRNRRTLRGTAQVARTAQQPRRVGRLIALIEEAGIPLYHAVGPKRALSQAEAPIFAFAAQAWRSSTVTRAEFETWIAGDLARLAATVDRVLVEASIAPDAGWIACS